MDDYRKKAHQKYLEQKKIKIMEEEQTSKEEERKKKEEEEKIKKLKEEQLKKEFYVQSQILIIDEAIESYKSDNTDDNIMLILTIINACLENISSMWKQEDIKNITRLVIAFSNNVDANNNGRPKGLNTIANVKILKEGFEKIFKLLNLNVEIQTLDTDKDEEIARKLEESLKPNDAEIARKLQEDLNKNIRPNIVRQNQQVIIQDPNFDDSDIEEPDYGAEEPDYYGEEPVEEPDNDDDLQIALRLQEELNKSKKNVSIKKTPVLSDKYKGLNCDDFINALMNDKI
jgi:hypothetical protein